MQPLRAIASVLVLGLCLSLPTEAHARDPECPELLVGQFTSALDLAETALMDADFTTARTVLAGSEGRIPCIVEVVPPEAIARFATARAYQQALDLDQSEAVRWALLASVLTGDFEWPAYVPPDHEVRNLLNDIPVPVTSTIRGKGLAVPEAGAVFLDGRFLTRPEASPGIPHLLQVGDAYGELTTSRWIDGVAFPAELLGPQISDTLVLPAWYGVPHHRLPGKRSKRSKRLESALGFAVAGSALFGSAWVARGAYDARPSDALFYTVNGAMVASGAVGGMSVVSLGAAAFTRR